LGLKLAAGSSDGFVRIYEATDVFSLNYWQLTHTFQVENTTISDVTQQSGNPLRQSEHGITCLAWNECVFEPAKIAVGGYSRKAVVWTFDASQEGPSKWREECELDSDPKGSVDAIGGAGHAGVGGSGRVINDIAWAPSMGRSYHLIATASRENCFRIHTLQRHADGSLVPSHTHCEEVSSPVWRVAWNATGTVLATSSEDGSLTYWRRDFAGSWKNVQSLPSGNESSASTVFHPNLA
jgi:nucleoporin SEH1